MDVKVEHNTKITLTLTESEAKWLKAVMQNPIEHAQDPSHEDDHNRNMRNRFWDALTDVKI
jgi:hypothetical protein